MRTICKERKRNKKKGVLLRKTWKGTGIFLFFGLIFFLTAFRTADTANAGTETSVRYKYYTSIQIEAGSSLWKIAQEYMTEEYATEEEYIREVKQINHMQDDIVYQGSYLCIPYYSSEFK